MKVILYIATSNDGFIADCDGGVDFLPQPQKESDLEVTGYNNLMKRIDTIVMGRASFDQITGFGDWAWKDKATYVFSKSQVKSNLSCVTIVNESPINFMKNMRKKNLEKDIWLLGGAKLAKSFSDANLIDELIITTVPQEIGKGISLDISLEDFECIDKKTLMANMVQKTYKRKKILT